MGLSMTFVLVMSELIISIFRKIIPNDVRIPIFIIVIASFTTIVQLMMRAYFSQLYDSIGLFIDLQHNKKEALRHEVHAAEPLWAILRCSLAG